MTQQHGYWALATLAGMMLLIAPAKGVPVVALPESFYRAIASQDWATAVQILDQVIRAHPQQAPALTSYRQELVRLQQLPRTPAPPMATVITQPSGIVPILRRQGGIPVIPVMFNQRLRFEMLVDSGASMTVITRSMARALGITPAQVVDNRLFHTANGQVVLPVVYVQSISVGGFHRKQVPVAVAGPEMTIGLLGQDFLQHFDVSLRQDHIQLQRRP
ncbi:MULTISPECIES: TIGR02281 family clan AA aspartic protease [unclassified Thermosynechococcus]|uniref:retropepsin-like aspartic protease family protein n=1 Tax=unclassified Thermosynechococcus TaxID=2622553 RepID=UPI00197FEBD1|nr:MULTISPECIES: retropepsin-like aspartic protease [unclassified Thermosynechococcus]MDR5640042.1 retropepsin-like aspartic protease [Thermosynechococcus sp. PP42]MDR7992760.1 retropepsin-like aspartic protease [Thermosynechococcus sp. TG252]QSF48955.1 retroviral-like aspartic protease family protein [Thermosynechococcus sp. TA-1]WKT80957.1 retropepsin-like aspartic protease [Thermosynechococcus sp. PP45]WNC22013.1 retropepsin-like aspartic protease [Thermosynechococcus sp. PP22]